MSNTNSTPEIDEAAKTELELYAYNTYELYAQFKAIIANLQRKIKAGRYNPDLAPKLWQYWIDEAAKRYCREFGGAVRDTFDKATREALAREIAAQEYESIINGEYDESEAE